MKNKTYTMGDETLDIHIIWKKRKTIGIYVDAYGNVEVRAMKDAPEADIDKMVKAKWSWIQKHVKEQTEKTKGFKEKTYEEGEEFLFLGREYPIKVIENRDSNMEAIEFAGSELIIRTMENDNEKLKKMMTRFYKQQCKKYVEKRIRLYQPQFKVKPRGIKISSNKKHWGTCNSQREMTFNWKLVMAPIEVLDYVVIHEMCHMLHMNHDRSFWRLVGKIMPDYERQESWLRESHWKMVV